MIKKLTICLIAILCLTSRNAAISQCNPSELVTACPSNIPTGFTFVKSYELSAVTNAAKRVEKSYVFSKDMTYSLALCKEAPDVLVKIYDSNRKEVASNHFNDKVLPTFGFQCGATGIYYMAFSFENAKQDCGAAVLAFKK
jgi:hypothetical protein